MTERLHLIEVSGRGGVFQHTVQVAQELADSGILVTLHTSDSHEQIGDSSFTWCTCVHWYSQVRQQHTRVLLRMLTYLVRTLPHLVRVTRGERVHLQGQAPKMLYAATVVALSHARERVLSPHNTFIRSRSRLAGFELLRAIRSADRSVAFTDVDAERLHELGASAVAQMPLLQYLPQVDPDIRASWRQRLLGDTDRPLVLLAGQVRHDKGVDDFIAARELIDIDCTFAVVGEDLGLGGVALDASRRLGPDAVRAELGFLELPEFVALLAAADIVVAPYRQASSSGVVTVAAEVGTAAVAYPTGGLVHSGARLAGGTTPSDLAVAIAAEIRSGLTSVGHAQNGRTTEWRNGVYDALEPASGPLQPGLTLICCSYNRLEALRDTLSNKQDIVGVSQLMFVLDGSTDGSAAFLEEEAASDSRIVVHVLPHGGVQAARLYGIQHCSTEWLLFLDDDDLAPADFAEKLLAAARANRAEFAGAPWVNALGTELEQALQASPRADAMSLRRSLSTFTDTDELTPFLSSGAIGQTLALRQLGPATLYRGNGWREETDTYLRAYEQGRRLVRTPETYTWKVRHYPGGQRNATARLRTEFWIAVNEVIFLIRHRRTLEALDPDWAGVPREWWKTVGSRLSVLANSVMRKVRGA